MSGAGRTVRVSVEADAQAAVAGFKETADAADQAAAAAEDANARIAASATESAKVQTDAANRVATAGEVSADAQAVAVEDASGRIVTSAEVTADAQTGAAETTSQRVVTLASETADAQIDAAGRVAETVTAAYDEQTAAADAASAKTIAAAERTAAAQEAAAERAARTASAESDAAAQAIADGDEVAYDRAAKAAEVAADRAQSAWSKAAAAQARAVAEAGGIMDDDAKATADAMVEATSAAAEKAKLAWDEAAASAARAMELTDAEAEVSTFGDHVASVGEGVSNVFSRIGSKLSGLGIPFAETFSKLGESIEGADTDGQKFMATMEAMGKVVTVAGLGIAAVVAGEGIHLAAEQQSAATSLAASADITIKSAKDIGSAFEDTAFKSIYTGTQMTTAYAGVAAQLATVQGHALSTAQATKVMSAANDLAEASGTDLTTSTSALATVMQAYSMGAKDAGNASDVLFNVSRLTGVTVSQVATQVQKLHTNLGAATPSLTDVGGLLVDLAEHGETGRAALSTVNTAFTTLLKTSPEVTATQAQLKQAFDALPPSLQGVAKGLEDGTLSSAAYTNATKAMTPAQASAIGSFEKLVVSADKTNASLGGLKLTGAQQELKDLGINVFTAGGKFEGFGNLLDQLRPKLAGMTQAQQRQTLTEIFGASAAQKLLTVVDAGPASYNKATEAVGRSGAAHDAAAKQSQTLDHELEILKAGLEDEAEKIGAALIPKLNDLVHITSDVVDWFQRHKTAAEALAAVIGGTMAVAVGFTAVKALKSFGSSAQSAYQDVTKLISAARNFTGFGNGTKQTVSTVDPYAGSDSAAADAEASSQAAQTAAVEEGVAARTAAVEEGAAAQTAAIEASAEAGEAAEEGLAAAEDSADVAADMNPIGLAIGAVVIAITELVEHWHAVWSAVKDVIGDAVSFVKSHLTDIEIALGVILGPLGLIIDAAIEVATHWSTVWGAIKSVTSTVVEDIEDVISDAWSDIEDVFTTVLDAIKTVLSTAWDAYRSLIGDEIEAIEDVVSTVWDAIRNVTQAVWSGISSVISTVWSTIRSIVTTDVQAVESVLTGAWSAIQSAVTAAWNAISSFFTSTWEHLSETVSDGIGTVVGFMAGLAGRVLNAVSGLAGDLLSFGGRIMSDLLTGITGAAGAIFSWFGNLGSSVVNAVGNIAGDVVSIGEQIVQGILSGLSGLGSDILNVIKSDIPGAGTVKSLIHGITHLAEGGVVTAPTLALVGEAGPEAVIPLKDGLTAASLSGAVSSLTAGGGSQISAASQVQVTVSTSAAAKQLATTRGDDSTRAIDDLNTGLSRSVTKLGGYVHDALDEINKAFGGTALASVVDNLGRQFDYLSSKATDSLSAITTKLTAAQKGLATIKQEIAQSASSLEGQFSVIPSSTTMGTTSTGTSQGFGTSTASATVTGSSIIANLKASVASLRAFKQALTSLAAMVLSQDILSQLVAAGPAAGLATAQALLAGGKKEIDLADGLQAQVDNNSTAIATLSSKASIGGKQVGEGTARSIVKGLSKEKEKVTDELRRLAEDMRRVIAEAMDGKKIGAETAGQSIADSIARGITADSAKISAAINAATSPSGFSFSGGSASSRPMTITFGNTVINVSGDGQLTPAGVAQVGQMVTAANKQLAAKIERELVSG